MKTDHKFCKIFTVSLLILISFFFFGHSDVMAEAEAEINTAVHSSDPYTSGEELNVTAHIEYSGTFSALGIVATLPDGWTYVRTEGDDKPGARQEKDDASLEFYWFDIPSSPIDFSYIVNVPQGEVGQQQISSRIIYRSLKSEEFEYQMTPLLISEYGETPTPETGYNVTPELWIRAAINTVEKGQIEAVWKKGGQAQTAGGHQVIWGHFYADPSDVPWGDPENPDIFVKIWFDASGRVDVNYFHVSVPEIEVWSDYPSDGTADEHGVTTMDRRYIRQYYLEGQSDSEETYEDGEAAQGYETVGDPQGDSLINDLRIGATIRTEELGPIDAVWRSGGESTTSRGDDVVWGFFYADPEQVNWGSRENPDLFVKIWFDSSGRIDVNFFHVSVPWIDVFSDFPEDQNYEQKGVTIIKDRYIRHEYWR